MKISVDAVIWARSHYNQLNQLERIEVWWTGGRISGITDELMAEWRGTVKVGEVVRLGSLRLKVIGRGNHLYYVMRDGWRAWLYYWLGKGTRWLGFEVGESRRERGRRGKVK